MSLASDSQFSANNPLMLERFRKPLEISSKLIQGDKFIKWDEDSPTGDAHCMVTMNVDALGSILYWTDPHKEVEVLHMAYVRDVRTGKFAKTPKDKCLAEQLSNMPGGGAQGEGRLEDRTITVVYGTDLTNVSFYNFMSIAKSAEAVAKEWTQELFVYAYNIFALNGSTQRYLEQCYNRLSVTTDRSGRIPVKNLVQTFSKQSKDDRKRVERALEVAGIPSGRNDSIDPSKFTIKEFLNFYKHLTGRSEVDHIFQQIFQQQGLKKRPYLTVDQFVTFLNNEQRDPRLNEILYPYFDRARALALIHSFEPNPTLVSREQLSVDGFLTFLMSEENAAVPSEHLDRTEDMTKPLSHYFINSSHNTYLTGHQLNGKSSVEIYRQSLLVGCRCVELDCWNGQTADDEPIITHGYTFCTEVPFKDVIEAIAESAFKTSEYPLILSFENHITVPKQQHKVVQYCKEYFGDSLLTEPFDSHPLEKNVPLPSPEMLKYKILIKNKKKTHYKHDNASGSSSSPGRPSTGSGNVESGRSGTPSTSPDEIQAELIEPALAEHELPGPALAEPVVDRHSSDGDTIHTHLTEKTSILNSDDEEEDDIEDDEDDEDEAIDDEKVQERGTAVREAEPSQEISAMVNYVQPVRFLSFEKAEKRAHFFECSSFAETEATRLLKEHPVDFVNYNKKQLSRVYPKGTRVDSSNYTPQMYWNAGCQLVALNFQTQDLGMMLNHGIFEYNGRCGYVLKPDFMRREDRRLDPFIESTVDGIVANTVKVKVISGQFLSDKRSNPYVEVDMYGLPTDTTRKKYKTSPVNNNSINPVWNEEPFVFKKVVLPNLAHLRFCVYDENGKMMGHRVIPVRGLRPGYRHLNLRNEINQPLPLATLFVKLEVRDYVPDDFSEFAAALMNPIQYQKEQAILRRDQQLRSTFLLDEEDEPDTKTFLNELDHLSVNPGLLNERRCSDNRDAVFMNSDFRHKSLEKTSSSPIGLSFVEPGSSSAYNGDSSLSMDRQDSTSASEGLEDSDIVGPLQTPRDLSRKGSRMSASGLKKANSTGGSSDGENSNGDSSISMSRQPSTSSSTGVGHLPNRTLPHQMSVGSIDSFDSGPGGRIGARLTGRPSTTSMILNTSVSSPDPKMDAFALFLKESSLNTRQVSPCTTETIKTDKLYEKLVAKRDKELTSLAKKNKKAMSKLEEILGVSASQMDHRLSKEKQQLEKKVKKLLQHNKKDSSSEAEENIKRQAENELAAFSLRAEKMRSAMQIESANALHEKSLRQLEEEESRKLCYFKEEFELLASLVARDQKAQIDELESMYKDDEAKLRKDMDTVHKEQVKELSKTHKDKQELSRRKREVQQRYVNDIVSKVQRLRDLRDKCMKELKENQEEALKELEVLRLSEFTNLQKLIEASKQDLAEKYGVTSSNGGHGYIASCFPDGECGSESFLNSQSGRLSNDGSSSNGAISPNPSHFSEYDESTKL